MSDELRLQYLRVQVMLQKQGGYYKEAAKLEQEIEQLEQKLWDETMSKLLSWNSK